MGECSSVPSILLLTEIFPPKVGGSGRWFWEIYRRQPESAVAIMAGADPGDEAFDSAGSLEVHRWPLTFPTRYLRRSSLAHYAGSYRRLRQLTRTLGTEIVHCGRCLPEGLLAWLLKVRTGVEYACYAHGEEVNLSNAQAQPSWYERRVYGSRELALMTGVILRNASYVIANSDNTRAILVDRWRLPKERVVRLSPGVDVTRFEPAARDPETRARLGWSDRPVVLTVGRLQKRKGHDVMISALRGIRARHPEVLYAIVGDGEERAALGRLVANHGLEGHVQFLGEIGDDEMVKCYQQCDLFVLPNRQIGGDIEGFGMVLLEAQACGRPVVAGASGGTAETMRIPETGRVVPCEGPDQLTALLVELLADPMRLERMGRRGREWVTGRFGWDALGREARAVFSKAG